MPITPVSNTATGTELATAINALITGQEHATSGNAALSTKVNSVTIGNTVLGGLVNHSTTGIAAINTKLTEVYNQFSFPSESAAAEPVALEIPEDEIDVTISAVARSFTFNVAAFKFNGTTYISSDVVADIALGSGDDYTAAVALVTALVAAGSVVIEDEGSGVLTETTA